MVVSDPDSNIIIISESELLLGLILEIKIKRLYPTALIFLLADGQEALQLLEQSRANLIIIVRKRDEGPEFQLIRTLRTRDLFLPIITIAPDYEMEAEAQEAGSTLFLSGSNLIAELEEELGQLLTP